MKTSPTPKEKEMAQKNLSAFMGLGDQQNLYGTVCRTANVEIEFLLVSGVKVHMCMNSQSVPLQTTTSTATIMLGNCKAF